MDKKIGNSYDYRTLRSIINANHDRFSSLNFDDSMSLLQKMNAMVEWFKNMLQEYDEWIVYLDDFQDKFDASLYKTVNDILVKFEQDGVFEEIIEGKIFNEFKQELSEKRDKDVLLNKNDYDLSKSNNLWGINDFDEETRSILTSGSGQVPAVLGFQNVRRSNIYPTAISYDKTNFIDIGKNLFNVKDIINNRFVTETGAENVATTTYFTYALRKVVPGGVINFNSDSGNFRYPRYITVYDSTNKVISGGVNNASTPEDGKYTIPENANWLEFSFQKGYIENGNKLIIAYSVEPPKYEEFTFVPDSKTVLSETQKVEVDKKFDQYFKEKSNIFYPSKATNGFLNLYGQTGDGPYFYTERIKVKKGETIGAMNRRLEDVNLRFVCAFDYDGKVLSSYGLESATNNTSVYTVASSLVDSISITIRTEPLSGVNMNLIGATKENLMIYRGSKPSVFVESGKELTDEVALGAKQISQIINVNNLDGKSILGFGTSITHGHLLGRAYLELIAERNNMNLINKAKNGAKFIDILNQITTFDGEEPTYIILDGGANDNLGSASALNMGSLTSTYNGSYDTATIYGVLEQILFTLQTRFPNSKIIFVNVHRLYSRPYETQNMIAKAIIDTCKKWVVPVANLFEDSGFNTNIPAIRSAYSYDTLESLNGGNGTHPNELGYSHFYVSPIEELIKKLYPLS